MIILDTNILIEIYKGNVDIIRKVELIGQNNIAISSVTSAELIFGSRNTNEKNIILKDLNKLLTLHINTEISVLSLELVNKYSLSHRLNLPDALIASTSLFYGYELYTLNLKDFRFIEAIKIYN